MKPRADARRGRAAAKPGRSRRFAAAGAKAVAATVAKAVVATAILWLAGCAGAGAGAIEPETAPAFREASVHDPSVIPAEDGTLYVFGSHLAAAKSSDAVAWEQIALGVDDGNPLIPNVTEELRETLEWAETDTLWAADVTVCPTATTICTTTHAAAIRRVRPWAWRSRTRSRGRTETRESF